MLDTKNANYSIIQIIPDSHSTIEIDRKTLSRSHPIFY